MIDLRRTTPLTVIRHCGVTGLLGTCGQIVSYMRRNNLQPFDHKEAKYLRQRREALDRIHVIVR